MKKRRQSQVQANMSTDIIKLESSQGRCPSGHLLPNRTNRGRCTPVHCAGSNSGAKEDAAASTTPNAVSTRGGASVLARQKAELMKQISQRADAVIERLLPGDSVEMQAARTAAQLQKVDEMQKIGHRIGRYAATQAVFKTPDGLKGADAENYFNDESDSLLPDVIQDLKNDIRFGDDMQRREARRDLLDITGKRRRESVQGGHAMIVLVGQNGVGTQLKIPWAKNQTNPLGPLGTGSSVSASTASTEIIEAEPITGPRDLTSTPEGPKGPVGPKGPKGES